MSYECKFIDIKGFSKLISIEKLNPIYHFPVISRLTIHGCESKVIRFRYDGPRHGLHVYVEIDEV